MSSTETIEALVVDLSSDPLDPVRNFNVAVEYEKLNQTASAVGFYLRAAEYGYQTHPLITYASLLRISLCIEDQNDRELTVSNALLQAIAYLPNRPEAYFLMSRFHERIANWQECYSYAQTGLAFADASLEPLPIDSEYLGEDVLLFEQAVSGWWIGRLEESKELFTSLLSSKTLTDRYKAAIAANLETIERTS